MGILEKIGNKLFRGMMHYTGVECLNPFIAMILKADEKDLIADEMFRVSLALQDGAYGLKPDAKRAYDYCYKAAEKGHCAAQLFMAMWSMKHPDDSNEEVLEWLRKAAEQGERQALYNLGISYHRGDLGKPDIDKANKMIRKSAEKKYGPAQSRMAGLYLTGEGDIEANKDIAKFFAMNGHFLKDEDSHNILISLLTDIEREKGEIDIERVLGNAVLAGEPLAEIAAITHNSENDIDAINRLEALPNECEQLDDVLGVLYWRNDIFDKAYERLSRAASNGFENSQCLLADILYFGKSVDKDIKKALYWVEKSLNFGNSNARSLFAQMIMSNDLQGILTDKVMRGPSYLELSKMETN